MQTVRRYRLQRREEEGGLMGILDRLPTVADMGRCAQPKPERGSAKLARQTSRGDVEKKIDANGRIAKKRDGKCRLPFCPWCAAFKEQVNDAAHVIAAKGMGGDPSLDVSQPEDLMRLCRLSHRSQEKHEWGVQPLTTAGTNGLCEFYLVLDVYDPETSAYRTEHVIWAREKAIGQADSDKPYAEWNPIRRMRHVD